MIKFRIEKDRVVFKKGKGQLSIDIDDDHGEKVISTTMKKLADEKSDNDEFDVKSVKIEEMEDLPLYDFVNETMKKN